MGFCVLVSEVRIKFLKEQLDILGKAYFSKRKQKRLVKGEKCSLILSIAKHAYKHYKAY